MHRLLARIVCSASAFAEFLPLLFRKLLVFMPALVQFVVLFRGQFFQLFVAFASLIALLRRQRRPFAHALLYTLLPVGRQAGITGRKAYPAIAPIRFELVPVLLQRRQNGLLFGR